MTSRTRRRAGYSERGVGVVRSSRRRNPAKSVADRVAARELVLYTVNDSTLYRQQTQPIIKNLQKKLAKGIYRKDLAIKLWGYLADSAAKKYEREFGSDAPIFNKATRMAAAEQFEHEYREEVGVRTNPRRRTKRRNPINGYRVMTDDGGRAGSVARAATKSDAEREAARLNRSSSAHYYVEPSYSTLAEEVQANSRKRRRNPGKRNATKSRIAAIRKHAATWARGMRSKSPIVYARALKAHTASTRLGSYRRSKLNRRNPEFGVPSGPFWRNF